jgi:hypothetical protein
LAKQMGTSVGMLEQHYSKMTATMAADRLAWLALGSVGEVSVEPTVKQ